MHHLLCRIALLLPALAIADTAPAAADWRAGWGLTGSTAHAPAAPTPHGPALLRLVELDGRWQARVDNPLHGPLQIELRCADHRALPGLPLTTVLAATASIAVTRLPPPTADQTLDLRLRAVPGDPAARPRDVPYGLPFDAAAVRVSQGPQGRVSHTDAGNRDAIDFALAEGTAVLAARAGVVMQVRDGFPAGSDAPDQDIEQVNLVRVLHDDGSMAVYAHLLAGAMRVRAGQAVARGQPLGRSGSSGFSSGPHLHFVVQVNQGLQLRSVPVRIVTAAGLLHPARDAGTDRGAAASPAAR